MYEKSLDPEILEVSRVRFQRLLSGKHFHITKEMVDRLIPGSIDLHVHAWPDAYVARQHSEIEIGRRATDAGMSAVVFKCQLFSWRYFGLIFFQPYLSMAAHF